MQYHGFRCELFMAVRLSSEVLYSPLTKSRAFIQLNDLAAYTVFESISTLKKRMSTDVDD